MFGGAVNTWEWNNPVPKKIGHFRHETQLRSCEYLPQTFSSCSQHFKTEVTSLTVMGLSPQGACHSFQDVSYRIHKTKEPQRRSRRVWRCVALGFALSSGQPLARLVVSDASAVTTPLLSSSSPRGQPLGPVGCVISVS